MASVSWIPIGCASDALKSLQVSFLLLENLEFALDPSGMDSTEQKDSREYLSLLLGSGYEG